MPVSYLSKTYQSNPYVLPLDLGLMTKVLSYKRGEFDDNAFKIQSQIDEFASLDVLKNEDKQYLNGKITNLVKNINSLGGVDLSDINVANQVESLGGDISADDKVINAIASTKKVRSLMSSYDAYKNNPKLTKFYSEANQYVDSKKISKWANDGQVGTSFDGPSSATPYNDYNTDFQKAFKDVKAKKNIEYTQNGFYLNKTTNESFTSDEIMAEARNLLTPNQREQIVRDGQFLYEGKLNYGKAELVAKSLENHDNAISQNKGLLKTYEDARELEKNPEKQIQLDNEILRRRNLVSSLEGQKKQLANSNSTLFDRNPTELMYQNYSNDYFRGLGERYKIANHLEDVKLDPVKGMKFKEDGLNNRAQANINAASALQDKRDAAAEQREWIKLAGDGKAEFDAITKSWKFTSKISDAEKNAFGLSPNKDTRGEDELFAASQERLAAIPKDETKLMEDYFAKLMIDNPSVVNNYDYDFDKDGKVTFKDFLGNYNYSKVEGNGTDPKSPISLIASALTGYNLLASGQPVMIDKFPEGTADLYEKMTLLGEERKYLQRMADNKAAGKAVGMIPNYARKTIATDSKTQSSKEIGLLKSELIQANNLGVGDANDLDILSVGKNPNGTYEATYSLKAKDSDGKVIAGTPVTLPIASNFAKLFGLEDSPYAILNSTVNAQNPFRTTIQSRKNYKVVSDIVVQQNGNNDKEFVVKYVYNGAKTGRSVYLKLPNSPVAKSAAEAYQIGKSFVQNWSKSKEELEQALLANQNN